MGSSNRRVLIYHEMDEIETKETVDIVLTPQFYIFLKEVLEIKFAYQAKNIAPAFFDDYLDSRLDYQYHVYKHGSEWYFFAYSVDEITEFLEKKGLSSNQIGKIYFIQELEENLETPVALGNLLAMKSLDGSVTILPQRILGSDVEFKEFNINEEKLQQGITIGSAYDSLIPFKETAIISLLLLVLGSSLIFDATRTRASIESLEQKKNELLEEHPLLSSSLQRNSELKKYTNIDTKERKKREILMNISKMMSPSNRLKNLRLDKNIITATIMLESPQAIGKVKKIIKDKKFKLLNESSKEISVEKKL